MPSIRELNRKISSLQNMKKVMSAMNMIASTKFGRFLTKQMALKEFTKALNQIRSTLFLRLSQSSDPVVTGYGKNRKSHIIIFTADRGLCGAHNNSIYKELEILINQTKSTHDDFDVTSIGSRGAKYCRKNDYNLYHSVDINEKTLQNSNILRIAETTFERFRQEKIGNVYMIYNHFLTALTQETIRKRLLPINNEEDSSQDANTDTNTETIKITSDLSTRELVESAVPLLVFYHLKIALLNSYLSENGARMTAMENASSNSQDLINRYGKIKNRARQTAITNELSEIVSGKEAMRG